MGRGERLGITIGTAFGLVFVLVNSGELPSAVSTSLRVAAVLAFLAVQLMMTRTARTPDGAAPAGEPPPRFGRGYWAIVAVEVAALVVGPTVLARVFDLPEAGVAWVAVVVGVHFNALAVVWRESSLHVLAAGLTLLGLAGLVLAFTGASPAAVATAGGVLPGFWLLGGGAAAVLASRRSRQPQAV